MASHKYKIREICGDWALDIRWGNRTIAIYFNSRNNAELVKSILEWEDAHPNEAVPYKSTLTPPNEPLTIEQLREMDGEPVWVEDVKHWALIDIKKGGHCYRHPPEGEEDV